MFQFSKFKEIYVYQVYMTPETDISVSKYFNISVSKSGI